VSHDFELHWSGLMQRYKTGVGVDQECCTRI